MMICVCTSLNEAGWEIGIGYIYVHKGNPQLKTSCVKSLDVQLKIPYT